MKWLPCCVVFLGVYVWDVSACYYEPSDANTCIVSNFQTATLAACQDLANVMATDADVIDHFYYTGSSCYVAIAISCQQAAINNGVVLTSALCDATSVSDVQATFGKNGYASYILPTTSTTPGSSPSPNTPIGENTGGVPGIPITNNGVDPVIPTDPNDPLDPANLG